MQFYKDGIRQAIELHGTPSCQRKIQTRPVNNASPAKTTNPRVQMVRDLFADLSEKYIEVSEDHFNSFRPILSLNPNVRSVS